MFHPPDQKQGAIADACLPACLLTLSPPPPCPLLLSLRKKKNREGGREGGREKKYRSVVQKSPEEWHHRLGGR